MSTEEQRKRWNIATAKYRASNPDRSKRQAREHNARCRSREEYRAKVKEWQRIWRDKNPGKVLDQRFKARLASYCMLPKDYTSLLLEQKGLCAICGKPPGEKRFVVDHDHNCCPEGRTCGKCTRGLIHSKCNTALGLFNDSADIVEKALNYLKLHKEKLVSSYTQQQTQMTNATILCKVLKAKGIKEVQHHEKAINLEGYHGDKRKDTAEIVIPRKVVGSASNDIGFKKAADGTFQAIISQYDSGKYNAKWLTEVKKDYAEEAVKDKAKTAGLTFLGKTVNTKDGSFKLNFVKA